MKEGNALPVQYKSRRDFASQIIVGGAIAFAPSVSSAKESSLETDKNNLVEVRRKKILGA
jgi:hypothetical protein